MRYGKTRRVLIKPSPHALIRSRGKSEIHRKPMRCPIHSGRCLECGKILEVRSIEFAYDDDLLQLCIEHFIQFAGFMGAT